MTSEVTAPNAFICAENVEASGQDRSLCLIQTNYSEELLFFHFHFADKLKG